MKERYINFSVSLFFILLLSCGEKPSTPDKTDVELTITDANGAPVMGIANSIYMLQNEADYEEAFVQKGSTKSVITSNTVTEKSAGVYTFSVANPRDASPFSYYLYVYKFDASNNINFSNFALNGGIKKLPSRAKVYMKTQIIPDDGNLVFYSSATNLMPIIVTVTSLDNPNLNIPSKTITQVFTIPGTPNFIDNITSAWFNLDPGKYAYYAKSNDGCVWQGFVNLSKGIGALVSLSKCPNGKISFFTQNFNSNVLPLFVTLNGQNLSSFYVKTITSFVGSNLNGSNCGQLSTPNIATFTQNEGFYQYYIESQNAGCAWTGQIQLSTDMCTFVGVNDCNQ